MECLTRLSCEAKPTAPYHGSPCGNLYVNSTKATFLDCRSYFSTQEEFDYFICTGWHAGGSYCSICNSSSTMFNMTLRFFSFGNTAILPEPDEDSFLWTRLPKIIKSMPCSVGGFMDMFLDCSDSKNVTSDDFQVNSSLSDNLSLWDANASSGFKGAIGEYVQCTLQSVVMDLESSTASPEISEWGNRQHDWSFLFVLVFIVAGGVGNILVCLAVCLDRRLQNVTNYFLLSLAIADLLVSLFVMPLGAIPGFLGKSLFYYLCTFVISI